MWKQRGLFIHNWKKTKTSIKFLDCSIRMFRDNMSWNTINEFKLRFDFLYVWALNYNLSVRGVKKYITRKHRKIEPPLQRVGAGEFPVVSEQLCRSWTRIGREVPVHVYFLVRESPQTLSHSTIRQWLWTDGKSLGRPTLTVGHVRFPTHVSPDDSPPWATGLRSFSRGTHTVSFPLTSCSI